MPMLGLDFAAHGLSFAAYLWPCPLDRDEALLCDMCFSLTVTYKVFFAIQ